MANVVVMIMYIGRWRPAMAKSAEFCTLARQANTDGDKQVGNHHDEQHAGTLRKSMEVRNSGRRSKNT